VVQDTTTQTSGFVPLRAGKTSLGCLALMVAFFFVDLFGGVTESCLTYEPTRTQQPYDMMVAILGSPKFLLLES
jgi:hypothetical protein